MEEESSQHNQENDESTPRKLDTDIKVSYTIKNQA